MYEPKVCAHEMVGRDGYHTRRGGLLLAQGDSQSARFLAESHAAMTRMDAKPTGDVDADFAAMMIAHHVGAIEMAQAQLRAGRNEPLRRLAQEIIVTQQQEIEVMRAALAHGSHSGPSAPDAARESDQAAAPTRPPALLKRLR